MNIGNSTNRLSITNIIFKVLMVFSLTQSIYSIKQQVSTQRHAELENKYILNHQKQQIIINQHQQQQQTSINSIKKKRLLTQDYIQLNDSVNCTIQPYNTATTINLGNCQQQLYYITIGIGTPPQYFNLQVDTGSNQLWVSTLAVNSLGYNSTNSSTFINTSQPYQQDYINGGKVQGSIGSDYVSFVNTSINVSSTIIFADQVSGLNLPNGIIGILGMGYTSIYTQPNFLDLATMAGQIQTNNFALNLLNSSINPILIYNQIPQQIQNKTYVSSVVDKFYWQIDLIGVMAGITDLTQFAANVAVIDSGTSLFYLNPQLASAFITRFLPATQCNFTQSLNICNCTILSTLPNITFIFIGVAVILTPNDYVQSYGNTCYVHIYSVSTNPAQVLLGDTLFMQYIITYSKNKNNIGFNGNTKQVYTFGSQRNFIQISYVMIGITIMMLIYAIVLIFTLTDKKVKIVKDVVINQTTVLRQRMTQLGQLQVNSYKIQNQNDKQRNQQMKQMKENIN